MGRLCSAATVQLTSHLSSPSVSAGESLRFQSEVSFRVMSEPRECQEKAAPVSKRLTIGTSADHRRSPIAINRDRAITYNWGGWIRTSDLLINSQALCQLSYTPSTTNLAADGARDSGNLIIRRRFGQLAAASEHAAV